MRGFESTNGSARRERLGQLERSTVKKQLRDARVKRRVARYSQYRGNPRAKSIVFDAVSDPCVSRVVKREKLSFPFPSRTRDQIRALAVSVRRLSLDISISLSGFRCRTSGNSREFRGGTFNGLKNDFAPLRVPPSVPRSFYQRKQSLSRVILPTTSFPTIPVCDM